MIATSTLASTAPPSGAHAMHLFRRSDTPGTLIPEKLLADWAADERREAAAPLASERRAVGEQ